MTTTTTIAIMSSLVSHISTFDLKGAELGPSLSLSLREASDIVNYAFADFTLFENY